MLHIPVQVKIADGRPADVLWVLLSKQVADVVYTLHENTVRKHDMCAMLFSTLTS